MEIKTSWEWIREHIDAENDTIIDLGCGDGNTWKMGYQGYHNKKPPYLPKYKVTLIDYNTPELDYPHDRFIQADLCQFIKKHNEHYNIAIESHVLEHIVCPTDLIEWGLNHADRVLIVVPIGSHPELMTSGDDLALRNPWVKWKEFHTDAECPHNAHIREFLSKEDFYPLLPKNINILEETSLLDSENNESFALLVTKNF